MEQLSTCLLLLVFERPEQVSLTTVFADFVLFVKYKSRNAFFIDNIFFLQLPPTDSRLRPDCRALENGDLGKFSYNVRLLEKLTNITEWLVDGQTDEWTERLTE